MRKVPDTAPSRQSRNRLPQAEGNFDMVAARTKVAAMPEAAPIRSRLRATCPFSRAFSRRLGVACSVWLDSGMGGTQLPVLGSLFSVLSSLLSFRFSVFGCLFSVLSSCFSALCFPCFERARLQPGRSEF